MLSVESYRVAMGVHKKISCTRKLLVKIKKKLMRLLKFFLYSLIVIIVYVNLHCTSVMVRSFTSQGVEINPGPRQSAKKKVVQASRHQGHIIKYGRDSAGKQCTANAYFAIIFSSIKRVSLW